MTILNRDIGSVKKTVYMFSSMSSKPLDEVHVSGLSIHGEHVGAWRIRRFQTETGDAHEFTQVRPPGG
jgi:hypothetical protein